MRIKLHHVNLCSKDVPGMEAFYRSILDLQPEPSMNDVRVTGQGYGTDVAFVTDGRPPKSACWLRGEKSRQPGAETELRTPGTP